jgi:hypothetical protein
VLGAVREMGLGVSRVTGNGGGRPASGGVGVAERYVETIEAWGFTDPALEEGA